MSINDKPGRLTRHRPHQPQLPDPPGISRSPFRNDNLKTLSRFGVLARRFWTSICAELSIKARHASLWLCWAIVRNLKDDLHASDFVLVFAYSTTDDIHHRETLDEIVQVFSKIQTGISNSIQYLNLLAPMASSDTAGTTWPLNSRG